MDAPSNPLVGHLEHGRGQSVARIRTAPAFATYRQIRLGLIAEYYRGVATLQGAIRYKRLGAPLTTGRGISYLLTYIGAFWKY